MKCAKWLAMIAGVIGMFMLWLPVSLQAQLVLSLSVLGLMFVFMARRDNRAFRILTFTCVAILALRYVFWRSTQTLPDISEPWNFVPGVVLYLAEMYSIAMLGISFFTMANPMKRQPPGRLEDKDCPTVDVFIPSYNEDPELLASTLAAAKSLAYPRDKLTVYLLDDGGTDAKCNHRDPEVALKARARRELLSKLCRAMDVRYHARAENSHAKAGNLNAGLAISSGELVVVFDADHAPVREFLHETVGYFRKDERLFLVQTPHFFLNPDPLEKNLETFANMPSENEMFYSVVQRGLDRWDASFFCGSAAVLRRAALEEADGFSGQSITEDCETALSLHRRGWHSLYVDKPLIAGLQPETFVSFIGQRARWSQGMLQILILNRPFLARGLTMAQRLCYAGTNLFWLFPLSRLTFIFAPLLYIFFSLEIFRANIMEFVSYTGAYLVASFTLQSYLYGRVRWPWISELYEYVQSVLLVGSIFSVIRNPRKPTFNVTAKGQTLDQSGLSPLARPYFAIFLLLLAATCYAVWRYMTEPMPSELLLIVAGWNLINVAIAGVALGVVSERRERRRNHRLSIKRHALLLVGQRRYDVIVRDASSGGLSLQFIGDRLSREELGRADVLIELRRNGQLLHAPLAFRGIRAGEDGERDRFAYAARTPETFMAIAELMYGDQAMLQQRLTTRQQKQGILRGSLCFLRWSFTETIRAFSYAVGFTGDDTFQSLADAPLQILEQHPVRLEQRFLQAGGIARA